MDALLRRAVRDHSRGNWHPAGEHVEVFGRIRRPDFNARAMTKVRSLMAQRRCCSRTNSVRDSAPATCRRRKP
jgi:hypothetical protein